MVTRLNAEVGELVVTGTMNNAGTVIMEVADLSQMLLNTRVDETSVADVQVGQKATVRMEAYREKIFEGTVVSVALANFDPNTARGGGGNRFMMGNNDTSLPNFAVNSTVCNAKVATFLCPSDPYAGQPCDSNYYACQGTTTLISRASGTNGAIGDANGASGVAIDGTGDKVAFLSKATTLGVAGAHVNAWLRDLGPAPPTTTLLSRAAGPWSSTSPASCLRNGRRSPASRTAN